jgi:hypothetical protein
MTPKKYVLTAEHRAMLPAWEDKWRKVVMSTEEMTETDREICREAVAGLYRAAKLPLPRHIVFVPSPFVLRFAGGFAAAIWYRHKKGSDATHTATRAATWYECSLPSIVAWVRPAAGTDAKMWWLCAQSAYRLWQGGNQWAGWDGFLTFFRDVAGLELPAHEAYKYWEALALHSGPRIMHPDFCMISDRSEILAVDSQNRPHNETGPFCRWRDGSALYALNGVRVPRWLVETPAEQIDPTAFAKEANVEVRREIVRKIGVERLCQKLGSKMLDKSADGMYELHLVPLGAEVGEWPYLKMRNPSIGVYHMEAVSQECRTVQQALNFRNGGVLEHLAPLT